MAFGEAIEFIDGWWRESVVAAEETESVSGVIPASIATML